VSEGPQSWRERKKGETRHRIEQAAWILFVEKGYDNTTIRDIANAAGVAERTFFRYFAHKEAVLAAETEAIAIGVLEGMRARPNDEPAWQALRCAFRDAAPGLTAQREHFLLRQQILSHRPDATMGLPRDGIISVLTEAVATHLGVPLDDGPAAIIARGAVVAAGVAFAEWVTNGATGDLGQLFTDAFDTITDMTG
jgi:AcrR family transcriptional regulator